MGHCLNPSCPQPRNPVDARFCLACGTRLLLADRYRALNLLGQGGFGRTFRAQDEQSSAQSSPALCALKQFIPPPLSNTTDKAEVLFVQEAQRLQELGEHPQIPRLLAHFCQSPHLYLIQEFVSGTTLAQELADQGCWPEAQIWQLLWDLLPVLDYVHRHQVIHRDLKPDNILRRRLDGRFVLVDFGAAKYTNETLLQHTGTVVSSVGYSAPEQLLGRAVYASDLYSLGATCIYLLTAIPPHDLYDSLEDTWAWQQHLKNPISPILAGVLTKLLQRAVKHRYASATAVLDELQALMPLSQQGATTGTPTHIQGETETQSESRASSIPTPPTLPLYELNPDPLKWQCSKTLAGFGAPIVGVVFPPTGQLVGISQAGGIKVWHLASQSFLAALGDHGGQIYATLGVGQQLFCAGEAGRLRIWQLETGELLAHQTHGEASIRALAALPSQDWLAIAQDRQIQVWYNHQPVATLAAETKIYTLSFSPDGAWLVAGGYDGKLRFWQLPSFALVQRLHWQLGPIYTLAISPNADTLVAAGQDGYLKMRQGQQGVGLRVLSQRCAPITAVQFSPVADLLAVASQDGYIRLWQSQTGQLLATLRGHSAAVTCLGFNADGQWLASGSQDQTIRLWRQER